MNRAHLEGFADLHKLRVRDGAPELFLEGMHAGDIVEGVLRALLEPALDHLLADSPVALARRGPVQVRGGAVVAAVRVLRFPARTLGDHFLVGLRGNRLYDGFNALADLPGPALVVFAELAVAQLGHFRLQTGSLLKITALLLRVLPVLFEFIVRLLDIQAALIFHALHILDIIVFHPEILLSAGHPNRLDFMRSSRSALSTCFEESPPASSPSIWA